MHGRELDDLAADQGQLRGGSGVVAIAVDEGAGLGLDPGTERGRPAAQGMDDRAQRGDGRGGRLPAIGGGDEPDRDPVEIDAFIARRVLDIVDGVLDEAGDRAVVAGAGNDEAVGSADR